MSPTSSPAQRRATNRISSRSFLVSCFHRAIVLTLEHATVILKSSRTSGPTSTPVENGTLLEPWRPSKTQNAP